MHIELFWCGDNTDNRDKDTRLLVPIFRNYFSIHVFYKLFVTCKWPHTPLKADFTSYSINVIFITLYFSRVIRGLAHK